MSHTGWFRRVLGLLAVAVCLAPATARAQGFISPSIGFNLGGDVTDCESIGNCEVRRTGYGVSLGYLGSLFGFEEEIVYTPTFFGESEVSGSNAVTTIMSNLLLALPLGPVRPYGTVGAGAMRTSVDFDLIDTARLRDAGLGWVLGGGVMLLPTERFGVRVDLRHYRGTSDLALPGFTVEGSPLDFSRASASAVIRF